MNRSSWDFELRKDLRTIPAGIEDFIEFGEPSRLPSQKVESRSHVQKYLTSGRFATEILRARNRVRLICVVIRSESLPVPNCLRFNCSILRKSDWRQYFVLSPSLYLSLALYL
jgi:hypothetical protein